MPELRPITDTNKQGLPLDTNSRTKPLASAEKIRHTAVVPGAADNDADSWRIYLQAQIAEVGGANHNQLFEAIADDQEDLPNAADYEALKIVFWRGEFYYRSEGAAGLAGRLRIGAIGSRSFGYFGGSYGQFLLNPDSNFQQFNQHTSGNLQVHLKRSAWRAAKGSNEASGDNFQMTITLEEDTTQTETITMTYSGVSLAEPRGPELEFLGSLSSLLGASNVGKVVSISLAYNGNAILEALSAPQWVPIELAQVHAAFQKLSKQIESLSGGNDDARIRALEDKTSDISFDDQTEWTAADNTAVSGRYPYGRWTWIEHGGNAASYARQDYNTMDNSAGGGFNGPGRGLIWVIPNNLNWSRVRLVVRRADGSIRSAVLAQSLRNMPSGIPVVHVPSGNPDETARWSASSNSAPYAVSNIEATDTIRLETLAPSHTPVWEGEIDTGQVASALVTLLADENAYDALTSPDANRLYLW